MLLFSRFMKCSDYSTLNLREFIPVLRVGFVAVVIFESGFLTSIPLSRILLGMVGFSSEESRSWLGESIFDFVSSLTYMLSDVFFGKLCLTELRLDS